MINNIMCTRIMHVYISFQAPAEEKVDELSVITKNTEQFDVAEVTVSVAVLVTATEDISGNTSVSAVAILVFNNVLFLL